MPLNVILQNCICLSTISWRNWQKEKARHSISTDWFRRGVVQTASSYGDQVEIRPWNSTYTNAFFSRMFPVCLAGQSRRERSANAQRRGDSVCCLIFSSYSLASRYRETWNYHTRARSARRDFRVSRCAANDGNLALVQNGERLSPHRKFTVSRGPLRSLTGETERVTRHSRLGWNCLPGVKSPDWLRDAIFSWYFGL